MSPVYWPVREPELELKAKGLASVVVVGTIEALVEMAGGEGEGEAEMEVGTSVDVVEVGG